MFETKIFVDKSSNCSMDRKFAFKMPRVAYEQAVRQILFPSDIMKRSHAMFA